VGISRRQFRLSPKNIVLMQFILEGYEGLVTMTTLDPAEARVEVSIMPDFLEDMEDILRALKDEIPFVEILPEDRDLSDSPSRS
jgi:hypothetical protein